MADALTILREYNTDKKEIIQRDDQVIFGDFAWPSNTKTNYVIYGTGKDDITKDYYSLDCILFLLNNVILPHALYVRQAAAANVPVVRRPDRKDLLSYLAGDSTTSANIDRSAPLSISLQRPTFVKRTAQDQISEVEPKKPRFEEEYVLRDKERLSKKLDGSKEASMIPEQIKSSSLREAIPLDKIAAIKAKRLAKKRSTIKGDNEEDAGPNISSITGMASYNSITKLTSSAVQSDIDKALGSTLSAAPPAGGTHRSFIDAEVGITRDIVARERQWSTRSTILQSSGMSFAKNVFGILNMIKARELGQRNKSEPKIASKPVVVPIRPSQHNVHYNRFNQEKFKGTEDTEGFNIDTTRSFHGLTLKSVTEPTPIKAPVVIEHHKEEQVPVIPSKPQKKASRTPIIIIPAALTSLITVYNCRDLLQDLKFISTEHNKSKNPKRDSDVLLQRRKTAADITAIPYRIIDNATKLAPGDWDRVVAVFVQGPAWQFKGWPWHANPVEICQKVKAYHIKWGETTLDENIKKWNVQIISLDRNRRHLDRALLLQFWSSLDRYMTRFKSHLRF